MALQDTKRLYKNLLVSEVGQHHIAWLKAEQSKLRDQAEECSDPTEAYGLLKTAHAYTIIIRHLELMSS